MLKVFIGFVVASVTAIVGLVSTGAALSQRIAVRISLLARTVSILAALLRRYFFLPGNSSFRRDHHGSAKRAFAHSIALVLSLTFINKDHGAGVINMLARRVESGDGMKLRTSLQRVDFEKHISGRRKLRAENVKAAFKAFALGSRATSKNVLAFFAGRKM